MIATVCHHHWDMVNILGGYLVTEGCYHCRNRTSFFSEEAVPPIDDYHEGEHFWSYLGSSQASRFDLQCRLCGKEAALKELMALMLCWKCDPECGVYKSGAGGSNGKTWVYVALCADSSHVSDRCISADSIVALNEYFNAGFDDPEKQILVVPCRLRKSVDSCRGIVLADTGLTELY